MPRRSRGERLPPGSRTAASSSRSPPAQNAISPAPAISETQVGVRGVRLEDHA
jgi:hypothetical protein